MSEPAQMRERVLAFIRENPGEAGKREIARGLRIKGADRVELKQILADLADEGLIAPEGRKRYSVPGTLPPVTVVEITHITADGELAASPASWNHPDHPRPRIVFAPARKGDPSLGKGDRVLAKLRKLTDDEGFEFEARPITKLQGETRTLGIFRLGRDGGRIEPVEKKNDREMIVAAADTGGAQDGELVEAEVLKGPRHGLQRARVLERLGDMSAPRSISLIAIHAHGIPVEFPEDALEEAEAAAPLHGLEGREDLRAVPFVTIDPEDARDHDDAIHAAPDEDPANAGGHVLWIAIADVAHYVRPGTALDRAARNRGNSCYFPDRVVPMLPDGLSGDLCSLHEGVDRPSLGVRIVLSAGGEKREHRFFRGIIRSVASLTYERAQAIAEGNGTPEDAQIKAEIVDPLWAAYRALEMARERRQPLALDLPERRVVLGEDGQVESIRFRERFDAHKLVEECMVLSNVCAAETLEAQRAAFVYRVHEPPQEDRIDALRETLGSIGIPLAKGQRLTPGMLNGALENVGTGEMAETVNIAVLRAQTQAYYSPTNLGHFGLNLSRYAHFTSPIRRYADLIVHRALIGALSIGKDGAKNTDALEETAAHISQTERRAMLAERDFDRPLSRCLHVRPAGCGV